MQKGHSRHAPLAVIARAQTGYRRARRDPAYRFRTFVDPRHTHPRIRVAIFHEFLARLAVGMEGRIRGAQQAVPKRSRGRWLTLGAIRLAGACLVREISTREKTGHSLCMEAMTRQRPRHVHGRPALCARSCPMSRATQRYAQRVMSMSRCAVARATPSKGSIF